MAKVKPLDAKKFKKSRHIRRHVCKYIAKVNRYKIAKVLIKHAKNCKCFATKVAKVATKIANTFAV